MIRLERMEMPSAADWDAAIAGYELRHFYHASPWLEFIRRTQPVKPWFYRILDGARLIGYLPGFRLRKWGVPIYGSPFPGWTTPYMGPVAAADVDRAALLRAIAARLAADRFWHAELRHDEVGREEAAAAGFQTLPGRTYIAEIAADPEAILASYNKSARKAVHRAERDGLEAEFTTDPAFIETYYEQLREVFTKSRMSPTYPRERIEVLWRLLMPTGRMLATRVIQDGKCVATRIDFCGEKCLHSFGSASSLKDLRSFPNELARFHVMREAAARGLRKYDMSGGGDYKAKFNAQLVDLPRLVRSSRPLMAARGAFRKLAKLRLARGWGIARSAERRGVRTARPERGS